MSGRCDESPWGAKGFCGNGNCSSVTGACECEAGWQADRTFFKANNCWLPDNAMLAVHVIVGVGCLLVGFFGLVFLHRLRKEARFYASLSTATMFCGAAYMLAHALEGDTHSYASIILCVLTIAGLSNAYAVVLHTLLKPIYMFAGGNTARMTRFFVIVQCTEASFFTVCAIAMLACTGTGNDLGFSYAMAAFVMVLSIHFGSVLFLINGPTWKVVEGINSSSLDSNKRQNGQQSQQDVKRIVKKLKTFIKLSRLFGPAVVLTSQTWAIVLFAARSTPLIWVFYFMVVLNIPILGLIQLQLAAPSRSATQQQSKTGPSNNGTGSNELVPSPMDAYGSSAIGSSTKQFEASTTG